MRHFALILALTMGATGFSLRADERGDEVAVVYNTADADSKGVANHYAEMRHVPTNQVIGLKLRTAETMTRGEYRDQLEEPLRHELAERNLLVMEPDTGTNAGKLKVKEAKIRYLVLCYGVPLKIQEDGNIHEPQQKFIKEFRNRNDAAVDSELSLLPWPDPHYMLSSFIPNPLYAATNRASFNPTNHVLMVARLDGPSAAIARDLVDKAMQAERDGLWGRAYFDLRNSTEPGLIAGDQAMKIAAGACDNYGFDTIVDDNPATFPPGYPLAQVAIYVGWYAVNACGPFAQPTVEFMPGAFAYHLHSYSAQTLRSTTERWCGPLLAKGATATMGCVEEPYLIGTPNMGVFISYWLSGMTYGEAACAAQAMLSWQVTVIGDPLYRPFGRDPRLLHQSLAQRHSPLLQWSHERVINLSLNHHVNLDELIGYIQDADPHTNSAVLTGKLGLLYQMQGHTNLAMQAWEKARTLEPSPMQYLRLTMALGGDLVATGRDEEALDLYEAYLKKNPDYPDARGFYERMEQIAKKTHDMDREKNYASAIDRLGPLK